MAKHELNGFPRLRRRAPESLVHAAYIKLVNGPQPQWTNSKHFRGCVRRIMWQICVDWIRQPRQERDKQAFDEWMGVLRQDERSIVAMDDAIKKLRGIATRAADIACLRFIEGLLLC